MKLNRASILSLTLAAIAILGVVTWRHRARLPRIPSPTAIVATSPAATPAPTASLAPASGAIIGAGIAHDVNPPLLNRSQAILVYGRTRIQLGADCRMTPVKPTFENGATVMFDNRHRDAQYFTLDGVSHHLPGYGFKLLKLTAQELPHAIQVACGEAGTPAGEIRLQ